MKNLVSAIANFLQFKHSSPPLVEPWLLTACIKYDFCALYFILYIQSDVYCAVYSAKYGRYDFNMNFHMAGTLFSLETL